jgi:hypothetical protein
MIIELYKTIGGKWSKIAKKMVNRTGKQIRDRFVNYLDESLKKGQILS